MSVPGRRLDEDDALRAVVEGTVSETGREHYRALVRNLAAALDTHGAWVTKYDRRAGNERHPGIPEGLVAEPPRGQPFPAEATLASGVGSWGE
jgi:hypothetical protein